MNRAQKFALVVLGAVVLASLSAGFIVPSYSEQFRDAISAPPSSRFPLGTDDLGRDRLARLLYGTRVSLLLAPAAALLSTLLAGLIGGIAGYAGGRWERVVTSGIDLFLSLPWLFLLFSGPRVTAVEHFPAHIGDHHVSAARMPGMGKSGSHHPRRNAHAGELRISARSAGLWDFSGTFSLASFAAESPAPVAGSILAFDPGVHPERGEPGAAWPGVSEPLPSWGSLLKDLENYTAVLQNPWMLAPVVLLVAVVSSLQLLLRTEDRAPC